MCGALAKLIAGDHEMRGVTRRVTGRTLMKNAGGACREVGPEEELELLAEGWHYWPPPGRPLRHAAQMYEQFEDEEEA